MSVTNQHCYIKNPKPLLDPINKVYRDKIGMEENNTVIYSIPMNEKLDKAKKFLRKHFTSRKGMPEVVALVQWHRKNKTQAYALKFQEDVRTYIEAIQPFLNENGEIPVELESKLNAALRDKSKINKIKDPALRSIIRTMRQNIDMLSDHLIKSGATEDGLDIIIDQNKGVYVTTSYKIYTDPNWSDKVRLDPRIMSRARKGVRDLIHSSYAIKKANAAYKAQTGSNIIRRRSKEYKALYETFLTESKRNGVNDNELEQRINQLLDVGSKEPLSVLKNTVFEGRKDTGILRKKDDIPEWLEDLWGKHNDVVSNYLQTTYKMISLWTNQEYLSFLKENFAGKFLFEADELGNLDFSKVKKGFEPIARLSAKKITNESNPSLKPIAGMYVADEALEWLTNDAPKVYNTFSRLYLRMIRRTKTFNTSYSLSTQTRNFLGAGLTYVSSGAAFNPDAKLDLSRATKLTFGFARRSLTGKGTLTKAEMDEIFELVELGVLQQNVFIQEIGDLGNKADLSLDEFLHKADKIESLDDFEDFQSKMFAVLGNAKAMFKNGVKAADRKTSTMYQYSDNMFKLAQFYGELRVVERAFPDLSKAEQRAEAARRLRDTSPTYDMVPKIVEMLRVSPLVGTFVAFPAEIIRTGYNNVEQAIKDINSGNDVLRASGMKRLVGIGGVAGLMPMLMQTLPALLAALDPDDEDFVSWAEHDDAIRRVGAPWDRNASLVPLGFDKDGKYKYINFGLINPYSYIADPLISLASNLTFREREIPEATGEFMVSILSPYLGLDITTKAMTEVLSNNRLDNGNRIYDPENDKPWEVSSKVSGHLLKSLLPGTLKSGIRIREAITKENPNRELETELGAALGVRVNKFNPTKSLQIRSVQFMQSLRSLSADLKHKLGEDLGKEMSLEELSELVEDHNARREILFGNMTEDILATQRLADWDRMRLYNELTSFKLGGNNTVSLMGNFYQPFSNHEVLDNEIQIEMRAKRLDSEQIQELRRRSMMLRRILPAKNRGRKKSLF